MNSGKVAAVIHLDSNPVYHFANDLDYKNALSKVELVVSLTERENETTYLSKYVLPINHNFESWGDAKTRTGSISLQQPVIEPLNDSRQKESILLTWMSGTADTFNENLYHNYLKKNWETSIYPALNSKIDFKRFWFGALHDGIVLTNDTPAAITLIKFRYPNFIITNITGKRFFGCNKRKLQFGGWKFFT